MKKVFPLVKNKYFISTLFVAVYILILHDMDIFSLYSKKQQIQNLEQQIEQKREDLKTLKVSLNNLDDLRMLEKHAREHHYFKKEDEDLFIFSFE
ncbi:MAG: septum formation initiator family protein [Crocinitomicaceae bacterium]